MKSSILKIWTRPTHRYTAIAAILRSFGGMAAATYLPVYFLKCFPTFRNEYAMMNALSLGVFGLTSALLGGIISDKYESKNLRAKSYVCAIGSFLAFPLTALCCLNQHSFWFSMGCIMLKTLFSASQNSPAVTML